MVEVCSVHVRMRLHVLGKVYTFHSFLSLNSTYITSELPNLFTIFVLMLTVISLSFSGWRHGRGVFCTCENETHVRQSVHFSQLFGPQFYIHHLWTIKLVHHLCFDAISHNMFRRLATWLRCVLYMWEWDILSHVWQCVHFSQLFGPQFHIHHLWTTKLVHHLCF